MSASSSRIIIAPVDGSRPLADRFIDRLLGWWDVGGGRRMRHAVRAAAAASSAKVRTTVAPLMARPLIAKSVAIFLAGLTAPRRWVGKAFSSDVPAAAPQAVAQRTAEVAVDAPVGDAPPHPATIAKPTTAEIRAQHRSATAEIRTPTRTGTAEIRTHIRSHTGELTPRNASSITKATITPVSAAEPQTTTMTTNLRCWSCLQRNRVRTPRRGGCFLCAGCKSTMLVVDPVVGLTCDVTQAATRGITLSREADETGELVRPPLI